MAVLGKIRSKGAILVGAISLALVAFLAGDAARSCEGMKGESHQQIGKILGENISTRSCLMNISQQLSLPCNVITSLNKSLTS